MNCVGVPSTSSTIVHWKPTTDWEEVDEAPEEVIAEKEPSVVAPFSAVDISAMRRRLSELEDEIERLQSRDVAGEDESDQRIAELEHLLEEKRDSEASLLSMLEEFQARLDQQRLLINQLMKRMDIQKFKTQSWFCWV